MATLIRDVMTTDVVCCEDKQTAREAAEAMRDREIGDVVVTHDGHLCGIVTDRDIVVRVIASGKDPADTTLDAFCTEKLTTINPDTAIDQAVQLMRDKAIRRLPVVDDGRPVGFVSIGDLAMERESDSALADISAAPPND